MGLQHRDRVRGVLLGQERLHRLVEPLHLAAGLWVVGTGVPVVDPEREQLGLHNVGSAPVPGRVDAAVVGEQRRREPPACTRLLERSEHRRRRRPSEHPGPDRQT